ncbi:MAG: hypothetical protein V1777_04270 [Candidatus Micrarchaeota archaeon]
MQIAVVFFSRSKKNTVLAANTLFSAIPSLPSEKELISIKALKEKQKKGFLDLNPQEKISLVSTKTDLSGFDFVFFGSTIEGMSPKRKIPDEMLTYLRECKGIEGKKAALFLPAFGVAGTVAKKMESVLQTRNVTIVDTLVLPYLLNITAPQLEQIKTFTATALQK